MLIQSCTNVLHDLHFAQIYYNFCLFKFLYNFFFLKVGDKIGEKEKISCPEGWEWTGDWQVDDNRAVDDEGIMKAI